METSAAQAVAGWVIAVVVVLGLAYLLLKFYAALYKEARRRSKR